jgi:hypothetical protein
MKISAFILACCFAALSFSDQAAAGTSGNWWKPPPHPSFDIQLTELRSDTVPQVDIAELDIDTPPTVLEAVRARGTRLICYFSAGLRESGRGDAASFPPAVTGKTYGQSQGRWLDIRKIEALAPAMTARIERCKEKGFDAIDPDNLDGYENRSGFSLTKADAARYAEWLMQAAHARGLAVALRNSSSIAGGMNDAGFDLAVAESCFRYGFCGKYAPFIASGKPVLDIEYKNEGMSLSKFCGAAKEKGIDAILKRSSARIDASRETCPVETIPD